MRRLYCAILAVFVYCAPGLAVPTNVPSSVPGRGVMVPDSAPPAYGALLQYNTNWLCMWGTPTNLVAALTNFSWGAITGAISGQLDYWSNYQFLVAYCGTNNTNAADALSYATAWTATNLTNIAALNTHLLAVSNAVNAWTNSTGNISTALDIAEAVIVTLQTSNDMWNAQIGSNDNDIAWLTNQCWTLSNKTVVAGTGITVTPTNGLWTNTSLTLAFDYNWGDTRYLRSSTNIIGELYIADTTVLGADLVYNGGFTNGANGWTLAGAAAPVLSGTYSNAIIVPAGSWGNFYSVTNAELVAGRGYWVTFRNMLIGTSPVTNWIYAGGNGFLMTVESTGTNSMFVMPGWGGSFDFWMGAPTDGDAYIDDLTIQEVQKGNLWANRIYANQVCSPHRFSARTMGSTSLLATNAAFASLDYFYTNFTIDKASFGADVRGVVGNASDIDIAGDAATLIGYNSGTQTWQNNSFAMGFVGMNSGIIRHGQRAGSWVFGYIGQDDIVTNAGYANLMLASCPTVAGQSVVSTGDAALVIGHQLTNTHDRVILVGTNVYSRADDAVHTPRLYVWDDIYTGAIGSESNGVSFSHTWYSPRGLGGAVTNWWTNRQDYINGILVRWTTNGVAIP